MARRSSPLQGEAARGGSAFDAVKVPSRWSVQNFEPLGVNKRHIWNPDLPQWRCFSPASTLPETARNAETPALSRCLILHEQPRA
jgi:hypothetical protein